MSLSLGNHETHNSYVFPFKVSNSALPSLVKNMDELQACDPEHHERKHAAFQQGPTNVDVTGPLNVQHSLSLEHN
jgi:hypothetical protein